MVSDIIAGHHSLCFDHSEVGSQIAHKHCFPFLDDDEKKGFRLPAMALVTVQNFSVDVHPPLKKLFSSPLSFARDCIAGNVSRISVVHIHAAVH